MGNMKDGQYQSSSLLTQHGVKQIGLSPTGTIGPYSDPWEGSPGHREGIWCPLQERNSSKSQEDICLAVCGGASTFYTS